MTRQHSQRLESEQAVDAEKPSMGLREDALKIELFRVLSELECSLAEDIGTSARSIQLFCHAKEKIHDLFAKPEGDSLRRRPITPTIQTGALMDLFVALFSDQELRSFITHRLPGGDTIVGLLPGPACTLAHLAGETAQVLGRRGLITRELFMALLVTAPGRHIDIWHVAATCGISEPSGCASATSRQTEGEP